RFQLIFLRKNLAQHTARESARRAHHQQQSGQELHSAPTRASAHFFFRPHGLLSRPAVSLLETHYTPPPATSSTCKGHTNSSAKKAFHLKKHRTCEVRYF